MSVKICDRCKAKHDEVGGYCAECKPVRKAASNRGKRTEPFYGTARWKKLRSRKLKRDPLCEECKSKGKVKAASVVDHIVEIADGGSKTDTANLMSLCRSCHARKTGRERKRRERGY